jgi:hypothetical protein
LEQERSEILIPLNVDGTKPSELPWRIVDVAYTVSELAFRINQHKSWMDVPKPIMSNSRQLQPTHPRFLRQQEEEENLYRTFSFTSVPRVIRHFRFSRRILRNENQLSCLGN